MDICKFNQFKLVLKTDTLKMIAFIFCFVYTAMNGEENRNETLILFASFKVNNKILKFKSHFKQQTTVFKQINDMKQLKHI